MQSMGKDVVQIGRDIIEALLRANEHRSHEIIAGIDGERFHAHDTHELVLLLTDGNASSALQIAALGHDIERFSVPGAGSGYAGERKGSKYEAYKKRHAQKGAKIMAEALRKSGIPNQVSERVAFLISHHDDELGEIEKFHDPELEVLVAADSLSWINFSAPNYFNRKESKGIPGLIDKMCFMLRKLPEQYWQYIPRIQLRDPHVLGYLKEYVDKIAKERSIRSPSFE